MTNEEKIADFGLRLANNVCESLLKALDSVAAAWHDGALNEQGKIWSRIAREQGHEWGAIAFKPSEVFKARNKALEILEQRRKDEGYQLHQNDVESAPASTEGHSSAFKHAFAVYLARECKESDLALTRPIIAQEFNSWSDIMTQAGFPIDGRDCKTVMTKDVLQLAITIQKREAMERDPVAMVAHLKGIIARAHGALTDYEATMIEESMYDAKTILEEGLDK